MNLSFDQIKEMLDCALNTCCDNCPDATCCPNCRCTNDCYCCMDCKCSQCTACVSIEAVYPDRVIIEACGKCFEVPYTITDNKAVLGDRKEVMESYTPLAELKDIEVLKAGTYTSMSGEVVTYTEKDLEEIYKNSEKLKDLLKPPLVATHDEGTDASVQVFGSVHGGVFHNVRKVGDKLLADIKGMPKKALTLLKEVEEFRLSPEIYKNYEYDGRSYGKAIRRIAWVSIPAIKTLAGVTSANLFEEAPDQPTTWLAFNEGVQSKNRKENTMKTGIEKLQEETSKLSEQVLNLTRENANLKARETQALTKLSEKEAVEKKTKVSGMIKPFRDAGLAPAVAERLEKFAEALDGSKVEKFGEKEHTQLDEFGSVLDSLFQKNKDGKLIVQFGELAKGGDAKLQEGDAVAAMIAAASPKKI